MALGLASLLCIFVTGVPAVVLGAIALSRASPPAKKKALVGMASGGLMTVVGLVGVAAPRKHAENNSPLAASAAASATAAAEKPTVKCRGTGVRRPRLCSAPECADVSEALCPDLYVDLRTATINNWIKGKKWDGLQGRAAVLALRDVSEEQRHGRTCLLGRASARVHVCASSGNMTGASFEGLVKLTAYKENLLTDDLDVEVLPIAPSELAEHVGEAMDFRAGLAKASDEALVSAVERLEEAGGAGRTALLEVLASSGPDYAELKSRATEARGRVERERAERKEKRHALLEADAFERMLAVSEPLTALSDEWAIPPRGPCGTSPPGDEFARRKAEETRSSLQKKLAKRLFRVDVTTEKASEYDFGASVQKLKLTNEKVALGGYANVTSKPVVDDQCCNRFTGQCRMPDGLINHSCKPSEELQKRTVATDRSFDEGARTHTVSVPLKRDDAERVKDATWNADVLVTVTGASRMCSEHDPASVESQMLLAKIVGLRVTAGGEVFLRKADVKVSVDEAEGGAGAWSGVK
jgi:hypothetical protein